MLFKKVLIANRGEIALRVIRACRDLGIPSVAVYSDADRNSLHVSLADEAYNIGPAPSKDSYLRIDKIMDVIKKSGADAVHPGYGFLSENAEFAETVTNAGVTFIGPTAANMRAMGDKLSALHHMREAGVPTVPGSGGAVVDVAAAKAVVAKIGLPVMIKASAGGGGKGMRIVHEMEELEGSFRAAKSEGLNYFRDDTVYIERFVGNPKHIEVQVFGDTHGNVVHLFERECSVQRRNQKIIEECPSPSVTPEIRARLGAVAVKAAKAINYIGAGTMEFIFDNSTKDFYFMEMNTRLQVEHPITELTTGIDLVVEQLNVAAGKKLSFTQETLVQRGHAIEARICAEDPVTFAPSPGLIRRCRHPQGSWIRTDSYAYSGYEVPIYYDPMIAKLIAYGPTREVAIQRLDRALTEFVITGIKTNIALHKSILRAKSFVDGTYTTQFCEKELKVTNPDLFNQVDDRVFLISAAIAAYNDKKSKNVSEYNVASRWKNLARKQSLR